MMVEWSINWALVLRCYLWGMPVVVGPLFLAWVHAVRCGAYDYDVRDRWLLWTVVWLVVLIFWPPIAAVLIIALLTHRL